MSRLDKILAEKYGFSRNKAQQFIESELVLVNNVVATKTSQKISENDTIHILEDRRIHWVSRSAEKLFGFLENHRDLQEQVQNAICLDVGASTGGFTQVLVELGAKEVDSVDVGSSQLAEILRQHPRVFSFENTDIRDFQSQKKYDFIVCDASFISLTKIFDAIKNLSSEHTIFILLFKPQFEVGKEFLNKNGVPKNENIIQESLKNFENFLKNENINILYQEKSTLIGEA